jgi:transposase
MTKISKQTKLKALVEYFEENVSLRGLVKKYGINFSSMRMMIAAYRTHGADVILNPPKITPEFRIQLAHWALTNNASYTEVAAKFGYLGILQIYQWKEIYRKEGPNGLSSITKGRKTNMTKNERLKKNAKHVKKPLTPEQNRIKQLETENLELKIKLEASKLLALMKQRIDKSQK